MNRQSKPKLLITTPYLGMNGAETSLINYLNSSQFRDRFDACLISGFKGVLFSKVQGGFPLISLNERLRSIQQRVISKFISNNKLRILKNEILKFKPEVVLVNSSVNKLFFVTLSDLNIPVILYSHELSDRLNKFDKDYLNLIANYPRKIITSSTKGKSYFVNKGAKNVSVLRPGIDFSPFHFNKNEDNKKRIWISSGNLDKNKNPKLFLEIAKAFISNENINFIWIGGDLNSTYGREILDCRDELGLMEKVKFVGWQDEEYADYFRNAFGYICTSYEESYGITLLEAAYSGLKVISTPCSGPTETLGSIAKFSNQFNDSGSLINLINECNQEDNLSIKELTNLRNDLMKFNVESMSEELNKHINETLELIRIS